MAVKRIRFYIYTSDAVSLSSHQIAENLAGRFPLEKTAQGAT